MILTRWDKLPLKIKNEAVRPYYEILKRKRGSLIAKRIFDIIVSVIMIMILAPILIGIAVWIKIDSKGPIIFKQTRITKNNTEFKVFKFRSMVVDAEKLGSQVTGDNDPRITRAGSKIRDLRLDELPQLFNIFKGDMSFVGTRPETPRYVDKYSEEMYATLLMPAGVTSLASIKYKDEAAMLKGVDDVDKVYVNDILPRKMEYNLSSIKNFSFGDDVKIMFKTVKAVIF